MFIKPYGGSMSKSPGISGNSLSSSLETSAKSKDAAAKALHDSGDLALFAQQQALALSKIKVHNSLMKSANDMAGQ